MAGVEYSASMMCANYGHLEHEVKILEDAGIDSFHIDIMDGQFVPNFAMGLQDLEFIRKATKKEVEVHLMIKKPGSYLDLFINRGVDTIYIHPEADYHPSTTLQKIIEAGIKPGIAINPGTSIESILELLYIVDKVLIMSVNPGHAGQIYLPYVGQKVDKLLAMKDEYNIDVYWDGACGMDKIETFAPKGMKGFVLGTTVLFGKNRSYGDILADLRKI
ncbi:ribulose-phosphate 3-epimerase [Propionispira arboris]|uniref:Ribulose-phosphate 3-epimerase n=1 Tax=Propionispira arboris TaxID=84035 RepID=A0A1H7CD63_9FIRM|nr:ribulose-phosphate 3-epimerase [Propionispira arboris]SEJ87631.1 ribulose-phosphate 3-epimerase [Propionispira arboris]